MHGCALMAGRSTRRAMHAWCTHIALMHDRCDILCFPVPPTVMAMGQSKWAAIAGKVRCLKLCRPSRGLLETSQSSAWWRNASSPCSKVPFDAIVACRWAACNWHTACCSLITFHAHMCVPEHTCGSSHGPPATAGRPRQGGGGPGGQPGALGLAGLARARWQPAPVGRGLRRLPGLARLRRHLPGAPRGRVLAHAAHTAQGSSEHLPFLPLPCVPCLHGSQLLMRMTP